MRYLLQYKNEIIIVFIILFFSLAVKGKIGSYGRRIQEIKVERDNLEKNRALSLQWEKTEKDYEKLKNKFFRTDIAGLKRFVEEKAKAAAMDLEYFSPSYNEQQFYWDTTMEMRSIAAYKEVVNFVKLLEEENIKVTRLSVMDSLEGRKLTLTLRGIILKDLP